MTVVSLSLIPYRAALRTPFVTALRRVEALESRIVRIETDEGYVGIGEAAPTPQITGEDLASFEDSFELYAKRLKGFAYDTIDEALALVAESLSGRTTFKSAIECALYRIEAQRHNMPLYKVLGGETTILRTDITVSLNDIDTMLHDVRNALARGYDALKIKIGEDWRSDAERIEAIADLLPPHATLRLDANQGWSADDTLRLLERIETKGIIAECIEQPVPAHDIEGMARIKKNARTPLLADEAVFSLDDARRLIEADAADMINIKLAKTGGISGALALGELCRDNGMKCMMGCMLEGPVAIAAAAHTAAALRDVVTLVDLDAVALLRSPHNPTDVLFDESRIYLPGSSKEAPSS
jgi:L-alanine-DL-glutamate epimerase-like enolase superfamily enzyme